jgi:hypothetical protein
MEKIWLYKTAFLRHFLECNRVEVFYKFVEESLRYPVVKNEKKIFDFDASF